MILIHGEEGAWEALSPEDMAAGMAEYMAYTEALRKAGKYVVGEELNKAVTGRTVKVRGGAPQVADGPYADIKEQLGGFYLIEADSLDEAVSWGARCPGAKHGTIEVRPVIQH